LESSSSSSNAMILKLRKTGSCMALFFHTHSDCPENDKKKKLQKKKKKKRRRFYNGVQTSHKSKEPIFGRRGAA